MIFESNETKRRFIAPVPGIITAALHGSLLLYLVLWPESGITKNPSAYEQLIKGRESKIVFYRLKEKLPDVKPVKVSDSRPPRAEVKIPNQSIVSMPKDAPKAPQMIWQPAPELKEVKVVPSPNILALKMSAPAPLERKKFVQPVEHRKEAKALPSPKLPEAPQAITSNSSPKLLDQLGALPQVHPEVRRPFVAPELHTGAARSIEKPAEMTAPPSLPVASMTASGPSLSELNIAVVGLNPSDRNAPLPEGSRAAQFSAGPKLNPDGGMGDGNKNATITVPDLMIKSGGDTARATLMASTRSAPTSAEALRGMSKYAAPLPSVPGTSHEPGPVSPPRVAHPPSPRFEGRDVYSMAIQMPNITSYFGSWLMWYADHGASLQHLGPVSAPVPHHKVDPKYIASAVADRVEGRVQLMCVIRDTGRVDHVELLKGIDERLDQSAIDALRQWEFTPATRSGVPVEVDVMVEIPFRLAPKEPK